MIKKHVLFAFGLLAAVTAACGGGGGSSSVATSGAGGSGIVPIGTATTPAAGGSTTTASVVQMGLTVFIPKNTTTSSSTRKAQYISPASQSFTMKLLSVDGAAQPDTGTTQGPFNLVPGTGNPSCVAGATGTTCTFSISAPVGTDIFLANTFSSQDARSGALGSGAIILSVRQNATNSASLALTGPVASVQVVTGTATLNNGNPVSSTGSGSSSSVARLGEAELKARSAVLLAAYQSRKTTSSRSPQAVVTSSPAPAPGPVALTSRMFVIALDAAGNQIINPTTFDIPITLKLNLNGAPTGSVTLGVTYAGLTNEPTSPASTSSDGGTVTIFAPSDVVSMTASTSMTTASTYAPSIVAQYTPQGGSPQTTAPLTYQLMIPPPNAYFSGSIALTDPWQSGTTQTVTFTLTNSGTLATSQSTGVNLYLGYYAGSSWLDATGSSAGWSCSPSGYIMSCSNPNPIAAGATTTLVTHVQAGIYYANDTIQSTFSNNDVVNSGHQLSLSSAVTISQTAPSPQPTLTVSVQAPLTPYYVDAPVSLVISVGNGGNAPTTGTITAQHSFSSPNAVAYQSSTGTGWSCSSVSQSVNCTTTTSIPASNQAPQLTINVAPLAAALNTSIADSITVSGGGAGGNAYTYVNSVLIRSALAFSATGFSVGTLYATGFTPGSTNSDADASLNFGSPPSPGPGLSGTMQLKEYASGGGTVNILTDSCTNSVIDSTFASTFPQPAPGPNSTVNVPITILGNSSPPMPCSIVVGDSLGHQATLNINVAGASGIIIQSHRRTSGASR